MNGYRWRQAKLRRWLATRSPQQRPRFAVDVDCSPRAVMPALEARLEDKGGGIVGSFSKRHGVLKIEKKRRHFWSPELSFAVEPGQEETQTRVRCVIGPQPQVWTAFVFTYLTLFLIGLCGLVYGLAQLSLGRTPLALLTPVAALALSAFVYGAAFIGKGLGSEEIYELRACLDASLEAACALDRRS